jgi:ribosomal protein S18 acetylase RimI-like enzyme
VGSPLVAWAERQGYRVARRYRIGELAPLEGRAYPPMPEGAEIVTEPFPTPILPGARRLSLRRAASGEEIGRVVYVGAEERNRLLGTRECAAFDVAVARPYRGQGWGKALMGAMARQAVQEGYEGMQLHVIEGNTPAENLYFRSIGFTQVPEGYFVTMQKQTHPTEGGASQP